MPKTGRRIFLLLALFWAGLFLPGAAPTLQAQATDGCSQPGRDDQCETWVSRFAGEGFGEAQAIAVSPTGNRVFAVGYGVSGAIGQPATGAKFETAAFDALTGLKIWSAAYPGVEGKAVLAHSVAVSPDGLRVYVTGEEQIDEARNFVVSTVAYDAVTGRQLWVARYTPAGLTTGGYSNAISPDGTRVYAVGMAFNYALGTRMLVTVALDAFDGSQVWTATLSDPLIYGQVIKVSPDGRRVFSAGLRAVAAYDAATGTSLWVAHFAPLEILQRPHAIDLSPDGARLYLAGRIRGDVAGINVSQVNLTAIALDSATGASIWSTSLAPVAGPLGTGGSTAFNLAVSPRGDAVFAGGAVAEGVVGQDLTVAFNATTGAILWQQVAALGGYTSSNLSLAASPNGDHLYFTGYSNDVPGGGVGVTRTIEDAVTASLDTATGQREWIARYNSGPMSNDSPYGYALAVDPDGSRLYTLTQFWYNDIPGGSGPLLDDFGVLAYNTTTPASAPANMAVRLTNAPNPVTLGETLTYHSTVTYSGPDSASGVTLTDSLPSNVRLVSAVASQGSCSGTTTVTCALGTIPAGGRATADILVVPSAVGSMNNKVTVSRSVPEIVTSDNSATVVTRVVPRLPIALDDIGSTLPGTPLTVNVLANDHDPSGYTLMVAHVDQPLHGTAVTNGTNVVYTPAGGFTGTDALRYVLTNGMTTSAATLTVTVMSPNTPPVASLSTTAPVTGTAPLTVGFDGSASTDPDRGDQVASYSFGFGDGTAPVTQSGPAISHVYTSPGVYDATLSVTDTHAAVSLNTAHQVVTVLATAPSIAALRPGAVCQGGSDFQLTIDGSNFANGVAVEVNGSSRPATFLSATQVTATVRASDIAAPGIASIRVVNQDQGASGTAMLNVTADNTPPVVQPPASITTMQSTCPAPGTGAATGATSSVLASYLSGGSASDLCTPGPVRLGAQINGKDADNTSLFPAGTTNVAFRFRDNAGNIGTATSAVTVHLFGDLNQDNIVDAADLVILANELVGNVSPGTPPFRASADAADVNRDKKIDAVDFVIQTNYLVGNIKCLPTG